MRAWISGKVRFVYADAARAPYPAYKIVQIQNIAGTRRPDKRSASGNVAFVISLARFSAGFIVFNAYSTATIASTAEPCYLVSSRPHLRDQKQRIYAKLFAQTQHLFFCQATEENMPFCLMIKLKSRFAPFS